MPKKTKTRVYATKGRKPSKCLVHETQEQCKKAAGCTWDAVLESCWGTLLGKKYPKKTIPAKARVGLARYQAFYRDYKARRPEATRAEIITAWHRQK